MGDVAFSPDGRLLYVADLYKNDVAVINPQSGMVIKRFKTGRRPYRILFHPDGKSYFVTPLGGRLDGAVRYQQRQPAGHHAAGRAPHRHGVARWRPRVRSRPASPRWAARLFVAAANTNNVYTIGVSRRQGTQHRGEHQRLHDAARNRWE